MQIQRRMASLASLTVCGFGLTSLAAADTDGYMTTGWGVRAKGMAGVSLSWASDAMTVANNPAGMTRVGRRFDGSLSLFSPSRDYTVTGAPTGAGSLMPGRVKSSKEWFLIPDMGYVSPMKNGDAWGLAIFANGGMNTSWPASANGGAGTFGTGKTGVNLEQMFLAGGYAHKLNANHSAGLSLLLAYQKFSATGLQGFAPTSTTISNRNNDESTGLGFRLGWQSSFGQGWRFGAAYQPKINMSRFDKYATLFANRGDFDIPAVWGFGLSYDFGDKASVGCEIKQIQYSDVAAVANPMANMPNGLGSPNGPGFGWRDMTIFKLGYENRMNPGFIWRLGASYGRQPIPSTEMLFNILAPGVVEWHFSAGFTQKVSQNGEFSMALTYSPTKSISGPNANDPTQTIRLSMRELEFVVGYSIKF